MNIDPKRIRVEAAPDGGRYVYDLPDGSEAELTYVERPAGVVTIDHTETPPQYRNKGIAAAIVSRAVADFRAAHKSIVPACPFAYRQFREHPEWSDLLFRQ
jgi:predicted GNAT family acetyltransferase